MLSHQFPVVVAVDVVETLVVEVVVDAVWVVVNVVCVVVGVVALVVAVVVDVLHADRINANSIRKANVIQITLLFMSSSFYLR
jgi:hypothetical protein